MEILGGGIRAEMAYKSIILPIRIFDFILVERSDGLGSFMMLTIDEKDFVEISKAGAIAEEDARPEHLRDGEPMHQWMGLAPKSIGKIRSIEETKLIE